MKEITKCNKIELKLIKILNKKKLKNEMNILRN